MFGNEEENKISLPNSMRIALITTNNANPDLPLKIQEKVLKEKNKNLEFIFVDNVKDLFKYKELQKDELIKGLIDKNWINNWKNLIPTVIILYYVLQLGANKEPDEKNIYNILSDINNSNKSIIILVILISKDMKENPYTFNFNDRQKPYYLKNFITKDRLYIFQDEQIWKYNEFNEICRNIYNFSFQFYKVHIRDFKKKRNLATTREDKIENDIKLAVLSNIKTKKKFFEPSKYLDEAYEFLCDQNFDVKTYKYGSQPLDIRNNFYEIRATADWLFYKNNIYLLNNNNSILANSKMNNRKMININTINSQIKKCQRHIKIFSNIKYYDKGAKDYFHFTEYYWLAQRYKHLKGYIEENATKMLKINQNILMIWFMTLFKLLYNIIKLIKFYSKYFNTSEFKFTEFQLNNNKIIDINDIEEEEILFFGKPPSYYYINKEEENKKEIIGFNEEIYIKKFIIKNQIKYDEMIDKFKKNNIPKIAEFLIFFQKQKESNKTGDLCGISIYLNLLKNTGVNNSNIYEIDDMEFYNKFVKDNNRIKKFPKVHISLLRQYINLIHKKIKEEDNSDKTFYKKELFITLSNLGNMSKLTEEEESLFFELLNDNFTLDKQIIINLKYYTKYNKSITKLDNLSLNFTYNIKDINTSPKRKIMDLIEYELNLSSSLSKEKIKLNSLQLFFEYSKEEKNNQSSETFIKTFTKEELSKYELDINSLIKIPYKFIIKYKTGKIFLNKIMFSLCKKENIIYTINLPNEIEKTIFLTGQEADIMKINYPNKTILSGVNQLYKFNYSINKKQLEHIKIVEYKHCFSIQKRDQKSLKKELLGEKMNNESKKSDELISSEDTFISPSIFYFNEDKNNMEEIKDNNKFEYNYDNFESRLVEGITNFDVLFKFYKIGLYLIQLDIKYIVLHEEVNTKLEFNYLQEFIFQIINPLTMTHNISSNNYSLNKNKDTNEIKEETKEYLTDTPIKMNLIFNNELKEDIIIKDIQIIPKDNNNCAINITLKDILDSKDIEIGIKEEILKISNKINYTIPILLNFSKAYNDAIGKCKLLWTTKSLKEYENTYKEAKDKFNFLNETEFDLPNIYVKKINYKYEYKYEIKDDNVIQLFIKIVNESNIGKKLLIQILNNDETSVILSGITTYLVHLKYKEIKNIFLKLYVIQNGEIKLPDVTIKEVDYDGKERLINNFYSEKILLN